MPSMQTILWRGFAFRAFKNYQNTPPKTAKNANQFIIIDFGCKKSLLKVFQFKQNASFGFTE